LHLVLLKRTNSAAIYSARISVVENFLSTIALPPN